MIDDLLIDFDELLDKEMEDEEFRAEYERLGPAMEVARLRMLRGLTQQKLAELVDTQQPSISRLESGESEPSLAFLRRVADALNANVEVRLVPRETQDEHLEVSQLSDRDLNESYVFNFGRGATVAWSARPVNIRTVSERASSPYEEDRKVYA